LSTSDHQIIQNFHIQQHTWVLSKPLSDSTLELMLQAIFTAETNTQTAPDTPVSTTEVEKSLESTKILVVDDNDINLKLIKLLLTDKGAQVTEARDGAQAIELARQTPFDLILMDIHMPIIKGTDATRHIRSQEMFGAHVPIVALTADAVPATRKEVVDAGMDGYLLKPIDTTQLWNVIFPLLGKPVAAHEIDHRGPQARRSTNNPIRDRNKLLLATGGDRQLARQLFSEFCDELPRDISSIRQLFAAARWDELRDLVHRLHGSTSICGVPALNAVIKELEDKCKEHSIQDTDRLLHRLESEADTLLTYASASDSVQPDANEPQPRADDSQQD
jgi:two-component system sensor histidine kinase BarA